MNALGHMAAGLAGEKNDNKQMHFLEYRDADKGVHPYISHFPFIVLEADNSSQIRKVREEAMKQGVLYNDFTDTMTVGTSEAQLQRTSETTEADLEYFGICLFGETEKLKPFTKKFSLWK